MSSSNPAGGQPAMSKHAPSKDATKSFDTIVDVEDSEDEWWEVDENISVPPKAATGVTQLPAAPPTSSKNLNRANTKKIEKKYSVHKPTRDKSKGRQRKQNALAGIKVVTNFSKSAAVHSKQPSGESQQLKANAQAPRFVDLAALQALDPESTEGLGSFWKSRKNKEMMRAANAVSEAKDSSHMLTLGQEAEEDSARHKKPKGLAPKPLELDLSPCDRPIVIGISIPSARLTEHATSPKTAISDTPSYSRGYDNRLPETPTIIITPAHAGTIWSALDDNTPCAGPGHRPSSSIYSQQPKNAMGIYTSQKAPPMPQLPASVVENERQRREVERSYFSPDTEDGTTWEDETPTSGVKSRSRTFSTDTVFEEDESPILARTRPSELNSSERKDLKRASINTVATRHRSKGWWNYITTPFLTRSNTVASRGVFEDQVPPAIPNLAIAAAKAQEAERELGGKKWEKQFSPLTPATSTTINSDAWWDMTAKEDQSKHPEFPDSSEIHDKRHKVQTSNGTMLLVSPETAFAGQATPSLTAHSPVERSISKRSVESTNRSNPVVIVLPGTRTLETTNTFIQAPLNNENLPLPSQPTRRPQAAIPAPALIRTVSSPPPPPYSPPPTAAASGPRYRAILPPEQEQTRFPRPQAGPALQYPSSPGPVSPGLQQAMTARGGIPMSEVRVPEPAMSEVPLTPANRRPINLNSQYAELPPRQAPMFFAPPPKEAISSKAQKAEAKRRRNEKEDAIAHKAGGWWRGRGCIPNRGCYGRSGPEGRKKRRCYIGLIIGFVTMMIVVVTLATTLHRKPNTVVGPSQWLNITGFPPIFSGLSTVASPVNTRANPGCIVPATVWSCDLPKELHSSVSPNTSNRPSFVFQIQWDNSSEANATFANVTGGSKIQTRGVGNPVSARHFMNNILLKARNIVTFAPNPAPPSDAEAFFLGNSTDSIVSPNKSGEPTPFYISLLSPTDSGLKKRTLWERQGNDFPNITAAIPKPSLDKDGSAAAANLIPLPTQQPIRLYDRGLPTEHYGFYTFFDRSIFLKSLSSLGEGDGSPVPDDENGGATESEANFRVTWAETRFLVQMWTRMNTTARLNGNITSPKTNFTQPGTFPYPTTITIDRHGGNPSKKMVYLYEMDERRAINKTSGKLMGEDRAFGGTIVNPAGRIFNNETDSSPDLGGFDGGNSGCACQWSNFQKVIPGGSLTS